METWQALLCSPTLLSQQDVPSISLSLIFVNGKSFGTVPLFIFSTHTPAEKVFKIKHSYLSLN